MTISVKCCSLCSSLSSETFFFFFFLQSHSVKLWWPRGHGEQPFYHLTVQGFQDGFLILNSESKVRVHCLIFGFFPVITINHNTSKCSVQRLHYFIFFLNYLSLLMVLYVPQRLNRNLRSNEACFRANLQCHIKSVPCRCIFAQ